MYESLAPVLAVLLSVVTGCAALAWFAALLDELG